jgi:hypothetical protein
MLDNMEIVWGFSSDGAVFEGRLKQDGVIDQDDYDNSLIRLR